MKSPSFPAVTKAILRVGLLVGLWRLILSGEGWAIRRMITNPDWIVHSGYSDILTYTASALALAVALFVVSKTVKLPDTFFHSFHKARSARHLLAGFAFGIVLSGITTPYIFDPRFTQANFAAMASLSALYSSLRLLVVYFLVALIEETISRAYLMSAFRKLLSPAALCIIGALFFGLMHMIDGQHDLMDGILIALRGGLIYSAAYLSTERIWLPLGLHWGFDFATQFVSGDKESGHAGFLHLMSSARHSPGLKLEVLMGFFATIVFSLLYTCFVCKRYKKTHPEGITGEAVSS